MTKIDTNSKLSQESSDHGALLTVEALVEEFLRDLAAGNRSAHTLRAYRSELQRFAKQSPSAPKDLTSASLRSFFASRNNHSPSTRARTQAALGSFLKWAYRHEYIEANPMQRVERVRLAPPTPRGALRTTVDAILGAIPRAKLRDRLLFGLIAGTGMRAGEALALHVEDLDLTPDDEHLHVRGKGDRRRTILLDDSALVSLLRRYLKSSGYKSGPLFRAQKNTRGGSLRYQSAWAQWQKYCDKSGESCSLHQLRHAHATELVNDGVSLATIRKRLGHRSMQTTLRYAELSDTTADAEMKSWRRDRGPTLPKTATKKDLQNHVTPKTVNVVMAVRIRGPLATKARNAVLSGLERACLKDFSAQRERIRLGAEFTIPLTCEDDKELDICVREMLSDCQEFVQDLGFLAAWECYDANDSERVWASG